MDTWEWVVLGVAIALGVVLVLAFARIRRRRSHLEQRFGPEYQRVVADRGLAGGESHLGRVESEHDELELRDLPRTTRDRYFEEWRQAETRFVSDPRDAARAAERIVARALEERGYPDGEGADIVSLVSVDHPEIADRYRHGRSMLDAVDGAESTESLRKAMLDFRAVLEDVLQRSGTAA
ncbi:MAG TPA: hypothetical protein VFV56_04575 [Gaiellaceae bacterium]|jgi:hypothetical protein|nr:hypothetical protein [Gaiellaceae bacterium]